MSRLDRGSYPTLRWLRLLVQQIDPQYFLQAQSWLPFQLHREAGRGHVQPVNHLLGAQLYDPSLSWGHQPLVLTHVL